MASEGWVKGGKTPVGEITALRNINEISIKEALGIIDSLVCLINKALCSPGPCSRSLSHTHTLFRSMPYCYGEGELLLLKDILRDD